MTTHQKWRDTAEFEWSVREWAAKIGVQAPRVRLKPLKTKWASISPQKLTLTINSELMQLPKRYGEFVIVHELVHLLAPDHARLFKTYMTCYMPDWEILEAELNAVTAKV